MLERGDPVKIFSLQRDGFYFVSLQEGKVAVVVVDDLDTWWQKYLVLDLSDIEPIKGKGLIYDK